MAQTTAPKPVDWTQLNPAVMQLAMEGVDAVDQAAEAINDMSITYSEREDEAEEIFQKLRHTVHSDADKRVLDVASSYYSQVASCHVTYVARTCSVASLSSARDKAMEALKHGQKEYSASKKSK